MSESAVEAAWRAESRRVLATLVRLLGDFDRAEEALNDAFLAAAEQWPRDGVPENPRAWLVSAGRYRAIDRLRRKARFDAAAAEIAAELEAGMAEEMERDGDEAVADDRLRLIFACCHPALSPDAQVALTLREVCGLTTEAIAAAFLARTPAIAQRIVRAKQRLKDVRAAFSMPEAADLPARREAALRVLYLVFNAGYSAPARSGGADLAAEAMRLARLMLALHPDGEAEGLLALMLLNHARRAARLSADGDIVLLADQDRASWDRAMIGEGLFHARRAMDAEPVGPYAIQAAIAAEHARAPSADATGWTRIVALYDLLLRADPSPVVALNRAAAIAMRDGAAQGLALVETLLGEESLAAYHLAHGARADLLRRLGREAAAVDAYRRAVALAPEEAERRFYRRRLEELGGASAILAEGDRTNPIKY